MLLGTARLLLGPVLATLWRVHLIHVDRIPDEPLVVACNHISWRDPPLLDAVYPRPIFFMAKKELFEKPANAWLLHQLGAFPVDRSRADLSAIKQALRLLKEGHCVGIFFEGTRNKGPDLLEAKRGVAMLAIQSHRRILPIAATASSRGQFAKQTFIVGNAFDPNELYTDSREAWYDRVATRVQTEVRDLLRNESPAPRIDRRSNPRLEGEKRP